MADGPERPDFSVLEGDGVTQTPGASRSVVRRAGRGVDAGADWVGDRIGDAAAWLANLVRYLPARAVRMLGSLAGGLVAVLTFVPSTVHVARNDRLRTAPFVQACARRGSIRTIQLVLEALDLVGAPEIFAFVWRVLTRTGPLTGAEINAASSVLGPSAVRYQDIRVSQGGVLRWIFARNEQRAFATFHTINLPETGPHQRDNINIVVHEIVHVYQYERAGSRYFAEALLGQHEEGYDYGGAAGLAAAVRQGKQLRNFNREQQAQIAQDYYTATCTRADLTAYEPFIRQLREGAL
jgi:hypothetical protein